MASAIDETKPPSGNALTADVRSNFAAAKTEIEALQAENIIGHKIAQIVTYKNSAVATGTTTVPLDNTIPQNTEGDQYMSLSITPTNASSTLEIDVIAQFSPSTTVHVIMSLFQDAVANALASTLAYYGAGNTGEYVIKYIVTAGTTSATTFKVRAGCSSPATTTFNGIGGVQYLGGTLPSRITIKEYLP